MQREVLSRSVICSDGMTYEAGTPIEQLPADNRESCSRSGWTHMETVVAQDPSDQTDQSDQTDLLESDPSDQTEQTDLKNAAPAPEVLSEPSDAVAKETPLTLTDLDDRVLELLAAVEITTVEQARQHLETNRTFRTIEGIGKQSDAAIRAAIE
jgi:hypothetical protein